MERKTKIFISYSRKDIEYKNQLIAHLKPLIRKYGVIEIWDDGLVNPGEEWDKIILHKLNTADLIILLVSIDFLASDYIYNIELKHAIDRSKSGKSRLIPIIIRDCNWMATEIGRFQVLPSGGKAISAFKDVDEAWVQIVQSIRYAIDDLRGKSGFIIGDNNKILNVHRELGNIHIGDIIDIHTRVDVNDVFPLNGVPKITFVEPISFNRLISSIRHKGRGLVIEGPSGIGKTTALKKAIEKLLLATKEFEYLTARNPEHLDRIKNISKNHLGIVAIDDFHRLDESTKREISNYMKFLADTEENLRKLIIIGIPNTGNKLISFGYDLATRIDIFELSKVPSEKIELLIEKGEYALNVRFAKKSEIINAANGSLNIAQFLCHYSVTSKDIYETLEGLNPTLIDADFLDVISNVKQVLKPKFEEFIFSFSQLGGLKDRTCIKLLHEIAMSENGSIILNRLIDSKPHLSNGISKLKSEKLIQSLIQAKPSCKSFLYFDEITTELVIDDPQLIFYINYTSENQIAELVGKKKQLVKEKVFISYSHKDALYLERMLVHLKPLIRDTDIDIWVDTRIQPGQKWNNEIEKALECAKIAILIISADFIASDYITEKELPSLIKSSFEDGTVIIPIFLKPANLNRFDNITQYQGINTPTKPIIEMSELDQEKVFVRLSQEIEKLYSIELNTQ